MYEYSEFARFILIDDKVIRVDEIQTIEPSIMDAASSEVYFRNGKHVTLLHMNREQVMNSIFDEERKTIKTRNDNVGRY